MINWVRLKRAERATTPTDSELTAEMFVVVEDAKGAARDDCEVDLYRALKSGFRFTSSALYGTKPLSQP
jgi:hypothetical protein